MKTFKKYIIRDIPLSLMLITAYVVSIAILIQTKPDGLSLIVFLLPIIFFLIFYSLTYKKNTLSGALLIYVRALSLSLILTIITGMICVTFYNINDLNLTWFIVAILYIFLINILPLLLYIKLMTDTAKIESGKKTPYIFIYCIIILVILTFIIYAVIGTIASLIGVEASTGGPTPPF